MPRSFLNRPVSLLGQSLPMAPLLLIGVVVLGSAIGALVERMGIPFLSLALLSPALVMEGQIWRLVAWGLFETDGQNLVLGALMLGIFGRDLAALWGGVRYLVVCTLLVFTAGFITSVVGLLWSDVGRSAYLSVWPLADALIVAWALLFPNRTILFMLMLPMAGRSLVYVSVGMTVLFAIMYGFSNFAPHLIAMGLMYAYIRGGTRLAAQLKLNRLLSSKRANPGFKVVEGGWNKGNDHKPNGSGWVH